MRRTAGHVSRKDTRNIIQPCITLGVSVDWSRRGDYIAKHGVTPEQADEALNDVNAVIFEPDYNTISGQQVRTAPSATRQAPGLS